MSAENNTLRVIIDLMTEADLAEIVLIEHESFPAPWTRGMFINEMENPGSQCLCARVDLGSKTVVAAYIIFWIVPGEAHLFSLAVKKEFRRQNLAFNLLKIMEEIVRKAGIKSITLEVRESNIEAIKLYEKRGFVVKGRRINYYRETNEDALIMWLDI
ncbi:MAG TPA: ribosomal-protein-alanine N-acetyltransferase [Deltaproteobacteria bacterium]|nr:ribosomal-protein-alanine N-acetyltransferase [Deltaproteobacteria bacterium]